uniref:Uncharacterized protein n=1 Tax=viral metagenome TaxID=1070528 RepID=A0A6C0HUL1_9ZZZZ
MLLSGSVGYTLLEKTKKRVLILADIHDGVSYCKRDSVMIDTWLSSKTDDNDVLLEEVLREGFKLGDLWPLSVHTGRLKELNKNNKKIIPIDIRPFLIPFSWEILLNDPNNQIGKMRLNAYLIGLYHIFNLRGSKLMKQHICPQVKKLRETSDEKTINILLTHFEEMNRIYCEYRTTNKKNLDKTISDILKQDKDILENINEMTSMLMEWYTLLLILNSTRNSILHLGLAHSNRILEFLTETHEFKILKSSGVNTIAEIIDESEQAPNACLVIPEIL